jgi:predicted RNA-binding Zn-ribbon protein involved in translation (DUF1610 family)
MEIRELKKATPPKLSEDTKPRKLSEEEKQQRLNAEEKPQKSQHIKILECNHPVSRVICECWHCQQGLLCQVEVAPPQYIELPCPNCGKTAIRLQANQVLSVTAIPSPWS